MRGIEESWRIDGVVGIRVIVIVNSEVNPHPTVQTTNMKGIATAHPWLFATPWAFILGLKESQMTSRYKTRGTWALLSS